MIQQMLLAFLLLPTLFYFGLLTRSIHRFAAQLLLMKYFANFVICICPDQLSDFSILAA